MSAALRVPPGENGIVRVFSVTIEAGTVQALRAPGAIDTALGVSGLDPDYVVTFPVADLAGVGLATYLSDGCGIPEPVIAPERERLDAIEGAVIVVMSGAFQGQAVTLQPAAQMTLQGVFSETATDWSDNGPIETASALRGSGPRTAPREARHRARLTGMKIFAGFVVLVVLILALVI